MIMSLRGSEQRSRANLCLRSGQALTRTFVLRTGRDFPLLAGLTDSPVRLMQGGHASPTATEISQPPLSPLLRKEGMGKESLLHFMGRKMIKSENS